MDGFVKCGECMKDAPYRWCCKIECGNREECKGCTSEAKGVVCPNAGIFIPMDRDKDE